MLCCCICCLAANRFASGTSANADANGGGRRGAAHGRRTRASAYSGIGHEDAVDAYDDEEEADEDMYDEDTPRGVPGAVRVVRVGTTKTAPHRSMRGGGRSR